MSGALDATAVEAALAAYRAALPPLRTAWSALMETAVWGELRSRRMGALSRLRKRLLEVGEALAGLGHDRSWIPQPRERLKGVLGASIKVRDGLGMLVRAAEAVEEDGPGAAFRAQVQAFRQQVEETLAPLEYRCAELLDRLHQAGRVEDGEHP